MGDPINKKLTDILERTVRVETKLDNLTHIQNTADDAKIVAYEASASSRSAHKRLDKIDNLIFWLGTTVIGAVILAVLALIFGEGSA